MSTEIPEGGHKKPPIPTPAKRLPAYNIEKRPDRLYPVIKLHQWFAISSLALFVFTVAMVLADYSREWKRYQREYNKLSIELTNQSMAEAAGKIDRAKETQLREQLAVAETSAKQRAADTERVQSALDDLTAQHNRYTRMFQDDKATYDSEKYIYDEAVAQKSPAEEKLRAHLLETQKKMDDNKAEVDRLSVEIKKAKAELESFVGQRDAIQKQLTALGAEYNRLRRQKRSLDPGFLVTSFRNAPGIDFLNPSLHVNQIILPNLPKEQPFGEVLRADRCTTCHLAIDQASFEGKAPAHPLKPHPNMDLFLASSSPHPIEQFGCTTCHGGLDRATDFQTAGHTPRDEKQKAEWQKKYGWHVDHFLETPMYSMVNVESGCYKCHSSSPEVPKAAKLDNGRDLVRIYGCFGCHKLPGYENVRKVGPDLTTVSGKLTKDWVRKWLANPRDFKPEARMPKFWYNSNNSGPYFDKRNEAEINAIVEYLWSKSTPKTLPAGRAGDAKKGEELVKTVGCFGCHSVGAITETPGNPQTRRRHGYNLENQGSKVSVTWIYNWVKNPKQVWPETKMPNLRLTDEEASDITAYLVSLRNPDWEKKTPPQVDSAALDDVVLELKRGGSTEIEAREQMKGMTAEQKNMFAGKALVERYGCYGCHNISGTERMQPIGTELTEAGSKLISQLDFGFKDREFEPNRIEESRADWYAAKLTDPRTFDVGRIKRPEELLKMPDFGFKPNQVQDLVMVLTSMVKDRIPMEMQDRTPPIIAQGRQLVAEKNCKGCHVIEGMGRDIRGVLAIELLPPNLATEGAKTQPDFLRAFLDDPGKTRLRPWLGVRMPTFHFSEAEMSVITAYFSAVDKVDYPYISTALEATPESLAAGADLFRRGQCSACHPVGASMPPGKGPEDLAPDLSLAGRRLRPEWIPRWLRGPQKISPNTKMPGFFDPTPDHPEGTTQWKDVLNGDVAAQINALRDHVFLTLGGGNR